MLLYAKLCHPVLNYARLCQNYANYALCSDCVIMPKSNAGIIGLPQATIDGIFETEVTSGLHLLTRVQGPEYNADA